MASRRRFTLVELMIVVAILSLLAAIAIPMVANFQLRAKLAEAPLIAGGFETAIIALDAAVEEEVEIWVYSHTTGIDDCQNVPRDLFATDKHLVDWPSVTDCNVYAYRPDGAVRCTYEIDPVSLRIICDVDDDDVFQVLSSYWTDDGGVSSCAGFARPGCSWMPNSVSQCSPFLAPCGVY